MEDWAVKVAQLEQRCHSNSHRLDKVEERQDNLDRLVGSISTLANEQEHIKTDVSEIKSDVKLLTEKPARRWESMADKILWAVAGSIIAFLLAAVGL